MSQHVSYELPPYAFASSFNMHSNVRQIRLELTVAQQLGKPDHDRAFGRDDRCDSRRSQHPDRSRGIGREGGPTLGDAKIEDTLEMLLRIEYFDVDHTGILTAAHRAGDTITG